MVVDASVSAVAGWRKVTANLRWVRCAERGSVVRSGFSLYDALKLISTVDNSLEAAIVEMIMDCWSAGVLYWILPDV